jgi:hypothetical protein
MSQEIRSDAPAHVATARRDAGAPGQAGTPTPAYGPPPGYGAGPSPVAPARTEGTAVAALVCGFLAAPVGVVLGVVALVRIRHRGTTGRGLAIGGIAVGAVISLAVVALVLSVVAMVSGGVGASSTTACTGAVCETTVSGTPIGVDGVGGEALDRRFTVVTVAEGSAGVQGDTDTSPTPVGVGETFTVDGEPGTLVSATGGRAVFRYGH